jgi:hypothetical protein
LTREERIEKKNTQPLSPPPPPPPPPPRPPLTSKHHHPVEIRGGAKPVKDTTQPKRIVANSASWAQDLVLEVADGASELRVMLCRERRAEGRVGTSVVAACGIFVADILDAVPIDKYFELFKPGAGGEGGFVRIAMGFYPDAAALRARRGGSVGAGAAASNGGGGGDGGGAPSGPLARIRSSLSGIGLGGGGDREASAAAAGSGGGGAGGAAGDRKGKRLRLLGLVVVVAAVAAAVVLGGSSGDAKKKDEKKKKK